MKMKCILPLTLLAGLLAQSALAFDFYDSLYGSKTFYAKVNSGLNLMQDVDLKSFGGQHLQNTTLSFKPGYALDLVGGYSFSENIALEIEPGYVFSGIRSVNVIGQGASGDVNGVSTFANLAFHVNPHPYNLEFALGASSAAFAFQIKTGLEIRITDHSSLGVAYKFVMAPLDQRFDDLKTGDFKLHKVEVGWTYRF